MKTPKAPEAPNPLVTAAAQTGTNVATAVANANLQNVNQITPDGSLTYSQSGTYKFKDPTTGASYDLPQFTATTSLSPAQQAIADQNNAASLNLATTANQQSSFLQNYLGKGVDTSGIPTLQNTFQPTARGISYDIGDAGGIQRSIADAGSIQREFGDAGAITKTYNTDFSADRQRVEDALMARLNPSLERDRDALQTQLSNQGIKLGSTAYDRGVDEFSRQSNDARLGAILNAGQEQSRLVGLERDRSVFENAAQQQNYGQLLGRAEFANNAQAQQFGQNAQQAAFANSAQDQQFSQNAQRTATNNAAQAQNFGQNAQYASFNNQARSQGLSEAYAARNQPINEIAALMNGSQVQNPNFVNTNVGAVPTVDYAGLVQQNYQNQTSAYQQQMQNRNQLLGGILGLGGSIAKAGIGFSDRRLKRDIRWLQTGRNGLGIYSFRYLNDNLLQVGLMADEVERVRPEAVITMPNGFKAVDYGKALA
jgi:hypothetical protein